MVPQVETCAAGGSHVAFLDGLWPFDSGVSGAIAGHLCCRGGQVAFIDGL